MSQATIVDSVPSAPVSTEIDTYRMLVGRALLRTVATFKKLIGGERVSPQTDDALSWKPCTVSN